MNRVQSDRFLVIVRGRWGWRYRRWRFTMHNLGRGYFVMLDPILAQLWKMGT